MHDTHEDTKSPCSPWGDQTTTLERADWSIASLFKPQKEKKQQKKWLTDTERWLVILSLNQTSWCYSMLDYVFE